MLENKFNAKFLSPISQNKTLATSIAMLLCKHLRARCMKNMIYEEYSQHTQKKLSLMFLNEVKKNQNLCISNNILSRCGFVDKFL